MGKRYKIGGDIKELEIQFLCNNTLLSVGQLLGISLQLNYL